MRLKFYTIIDYFYLIESCRELSFTEEMEQADREGWWKSKHSLQDFEEKVISGRTVVVQASRSTTINTKMEEKSGNVCDLKDFWIIRTFFFSWRPSFAPLPSCVDGPLPPQLRLVRAGRVCAAVRCVCLACAAPRRSAHTPARWRWRGRRRRPQMSTPRRLDRQSCTWCLPGWLMQARKRGKQTSVSVLQMYSFLWVLFKWKINWRNSLAWFWRVCLYASSLYANKLS